MAFSTLARTQHTTSATPVAGIPVLPAVDVNLGSVTFLTPSGYHAYWSADASDLVAALGQSVRSAQWIPELGTLVVTVAQTGVRAGRRLGFRLSNY